MQGLKFRGRPPIKIAESVQDVAGLTNSYAMTIMDRRAAIDEAFVDAVVGQSVFGWEGRSPTPALDEDGNFLGTDLDLLSFLAGIATRSPVIELPNYRSARPSKKREGERHLGAGSRFGPLTGLIANQKVFSFSARIFDSTVAVKDPVTEVERIGAFRNFMLVAPDGGWHDGWDRIVWDPSAKENAFLTERGLWTGNTVVFKNAVHPNRWQSVFGAPYLLLKMLVERMRDEASYYFTEMTRLENVGIPYPAGGGPKESAAVMASSTKQVKIKVATLEAVVDTPPYIGSYPRVPTTPAGLQQAYERRKLLLSTLKPQANVVVRADELAYFLHGKGRIAPWMVGREWKSGYKTPGGHVEWWQMVLSNDVALRIREKEVTEKVASFTQY